MFDFDYSIPLLSMATFASAIAYAAWQYIDVSNARVSNRVDKRSRR